MTRQEIEASIRAGLSVLANISPSFKPHLETVVSLMVREVEFAIGHERGECALLAEQYSEKTARAIRYRNRGDS